MITTTDLPFDSKTIMRLCVGAPCLDAEFEEHILSEYGVTIQDKTGAPWSVVFTGPRNGLVKMFNDNWPEGEQADLLTQDSQCVEVLAAIE